MQVPMKTGPSLSTTALPAVQPIQSNGPDYSGLTRGMNSFANAMWQSVTDNEQKLKQTQKFKALADFNTLEGEVGQATAEMYRNVAPHDKQFVGKVTDQYAVMEKRFLESLDPELQDEFKVRTSALRASVITDASKVQYGAQDKFAVDELNKMFNTAQVDLDSNASFDNFDNWQLKINEAIDASPLSSLDKAAQKQTALQGLQTILYKNEVKKGRTAREVPAGQGSTDAVQALQEFAADPEINIPVETAAVILAYESGGTFSTGKFGGKGGKYLGIFQAGPEEQAQFGVHAGQTFKEQLQSLKAFLKARKFKPGMSAYDFYSTINAGSPGLYQASDKPGYTVTRHVDEMFSAGSAARAAAEKFLGGKLKIDGIDSDPRFQLVSLADRTAARQDAAQQAAAEYSQAVNDAKLQYNTELNGLLVGIRDGSLGQTALDDFRKKYESMSYEELNKAQDMLDQKSKKQNYEAEGNKKLAISGAVWDPTSDDDKKRLNAVVGDAGLGKLVAMDKDYVTSSLLPIIDRAKDIPTDIAGALQGMVRSNDPQKVMFALDTLSQIEDRAGKAFNSRIPSDIAADVTFWQTSKGYYSDKEILNSLRGGVTPEERHAKEQLRQEAGNILNKTDHPEHTSYESFIEANDGWFSSAPDVANIGWARPALQQEFNSVFTIEFARDGNVKNATERTIKQMNRFWGVSNVGGTNTLMKYPPELQYRPMGSDHSWINRQLRAELNIPDTVNVQLISDDQTEREVKSGRPASYQVITVKNGVIDLKLRPDGRPVRKYFELDPNDVKREELSTALDQLRSEHANKTNHIYQHYRTGKSQVSLPPEEQKKIEVFKAQEKILEDQLNELPAAPLSKVEQLKKDLLDYRKKYVRGYGRVVPKVMEEINRRQQEIDDLINAAEQ